MTSLTAACALSMSRHAMMTFAPAAEKLNEIKQHWHYLCPDLAYAMRHTLDEQVI